MAMAANRVIAEAETVTPLGALDADAVHTSGVFVDHIAELAEISGEYAVVQR
jgi:acetate CoA/acetoacetate CoA-transferase alpha subunit